jgi:hypothetical protein
MMEARLRVDVSPHMIESM